MPSEALQMKLSQEHEVAPELTPSDRAVHCLESKGWKFLGSVSTGSLHALHTEHSGILLQMRQPKSPPIALHSLAQTAVPFRTNQMASPAVPKHMVMSKTANKKEILCL